MDSAVIQRVCWLIAHHHTYGNIKEPDHQILVEADFLVNAYEDHMTKSAIDGVGEKLFKTETGKQFLNQLYQK